ncbi:MAG TPA: MogA/MoaB family molybdenum cofactor biosynthesis protein [Limnochordia bacterium]|nr:MogA/MoaB family molybdenum cofactor biosynthesis protein [Limnochordia bacterium]
MQLAAGRAEQDSIHVGILTVSDKGSLGERHDRSGDLIAELVAQAGFLVHVREIIPDDRDLIVLWLKEMADRRRCDLVLTTGGTGLGPRDVTPDATIQVLDYAVPGIAEAMRAAGRAHTPMAMLSRAVAGVRGRCLIINLPGSPKGVRENLDAVMAAVPHAIETLRGQTEHPAVQGG